MKDRDAELREEIESHLKMALLAPMPRPSVRMATSAKPGLRSSPRTANRISLMRQSLRRRP